MTAAAIAPGRQLVAIELIRPNPRNPRREVGDVAELTASIRAHGVLQALVAEPDPADPGGLLLIAGHRRLKAAAKAGLAEVPVDVREAPLGDERVIAGDQIITMLAENLHREDLTPIEEGDAYEQLRLLDWSPKQIAAELGRRKSTVDRRLALRRLPDPVRDRLHAGQVSIGDAEALVEFAADKDVVGRLVEQLGTPEFRFTLEAERNRRERRRAVRDRVKAAAAAGLPVVRPATSEWQWDAPADGVPAALGRLDVDDHAAHQEECPGRVLVVYSGDTQAVAGCLEASRHGLFTAATRGHSGVRSAGDQEVVALGSPTAGPAGSAEEDPERAALAAAADLALADELAAAAAVRRRWLRQLLSPGTRPRRDQQAIMLRQALLCDLRDGDRLAGFAELLGLDPPDPAGGYDGAAEWEARVTEKLRTAPVERVVQVLWAVLVLDQAPPLVSVVGWADAAVEFLDGLQQLGYQPGEVEQRMLAEVQSRRLPAAEAG